MTEGDTYGLLQEKERLLDRLRNTKDELDRCRERHDDILTGRVVYVDKEMEHDDLQQLDERCRYLQELLNTVSGQLELIESLLQGEKTQETAHPGSIRSRPGPKGMRARTRHRRFVVKGLKESGVPVKEICARLKGNKIPLPSKKKQDYYGKLGWPEWLSHDPRAVRRQLSADLKRGLS